MGKKYVKKPHHCKKILSEIEIVKRDWKRKFFKDRRKLYANKWWRQNSKKWFKNMGNRKRRSRTKNLIYHERFEELSTVYMSEEFSDMWALT